MRIVSEMEQLQSCGAVCWGNTAMRRNQKLRALCPYWKRFSVAMASRTSVAAAWLVDNFVNASFPAPATHYELVAIRKCRPGEDRLAEEEGFSTVGLLKPLGISQILRFPPNLWVFAVPITYCT
jgi:hypothetical protein